MSIENVDVIIIGAGVAGMTITATLAQDCGKNEETL